MRYITCYKKKSPVWVCYHDESFLKKIHKLISNKVANEEFAFPQENEASVFGTQNCIGIFELKQKFISRVKY